MTHHYSTVHGLDISDSGLLVFDCQLEFSRSRVELPSQLSLRKLPERREGVPEYCRRKIFGMVERICSGRREMSRGEGCGREELRGWSVESPRFVLISVKSKAEASSGPEPKAEPARECFGGKPASFSFSLLSKLWSHPLYSFLFYFIFNLCHSS